MLFLLWVCFLLWLELVSALISLVDQLFWQCDSSRQFSFSLLSYSVIKITKDKFSFSMHTHICTHTHPPPFWPSLPDHSCLEVPYWSFQALVCGDAHLKELTFKLLLNYFNNLFHLLNSTWFHFCSMTVLILKIIVCSELEGNIFSVNAVMKHSRKSLLSPVPNADLV